MWVVIFFFFSSRRRHTRLQGDWSSDVCSSDLEDLLTQRMVGGEQQVAWHVMAFILTAARLLAPSSELAIEQSFYPRTALDDVAGVPQDKVNKDRLYRALDRLLPHKSAIEAHLKERLGALFDEPFDILLYDLTSTYFEGLAE